MPLDINTLWSLVVTFLGGGLITWVLTEWWKWRNRPKLITYYGHVSSFIVRPEGENPPFNVHTHSVVLLNSGKVPVEDIRMSHAIFPTHYNIYPPCEHEIITLPDGSKELFIPRIVPQDQVTVSYLYYPPVTYNNINTGIRHKLGFAKALYALPTPQFAPWIRRSLVTLMIIGAVTTFLIIMSVVIPAVQRIYYFFEPLE